MTIAQADILAARIRGLPRIYEGLPVVGQKLDFWYFPYPWHKSPQSGEYKHYVKSEKISLYPVRFYMTDIQYGENTYAVGDGFTDIGYQGEICGWNYTFFGGGRYVIIDDLRMLAFLGIEYARAKLQGWKYRVGEITFYGKVANCYQMKRGYIGRNDFGSRYIRRQDYSENEVGYGGSTPPYMELSKPPPDGIKATLYWTPMRRTPGFGEPTSEDFSLPMQYAENTGPFFVDILLGTLQGNDDMVKFIDPPMEYAKDNPIVSLTSKVKKGGFRIALSVPGGNSSYVVYEQTVSTVYKVNGYYYLEQLPEFVRPERLDEYEIETFQIVNSHSSFFPLKKGVTYNVTAEFYNTELQNATDGPLVSCVRIGTRLLAPKF